MVIRQTKLWSLVLCSKKGGKGDLWLSDIQHSGLLFHVQRKEAKVTYGYQTNYTLVSCFMFRERRQGRSMVIRHSTLWPLVPCSEKGGKGDLWLSGIQHSGLLFHVQRKEARVTYDYQAFNTLVSCFMFRERRQV